MKRALLILAAVAIVFGAWIVVRRHLPSYVDYQGQRIRLTKYYLDYDDYKNDPENIAASETTRVQKLVTQAPIGHSFTDKRQVVDAAFNIKFPGYGLRSLGDGNQGEGSLSGFGIEIPRAAKSRYLVFQRNQGRYVLVDDFLAPEIPLLMHVRQNSSNLVYSSDTGTTTLVRPLATAAK